MNNVIYLDMDGVLADFEGHMHTLMGPVWKEEINKDGWGKLADHPSLYADLPMMPDALELYSGCLEKVAHYSQIQVLTALPNKAAPNFPDVVKHKIDWIHRHISPDLRVHFGPLAVHKQLHKKHANDVLIDDMKRNIKQWNDVGGIGILHTSAIGSLIELTMRLNQHKENKR